MSNIFQRVRGVFRRNPRPQPNTRQTTDIPEERGNTDDDVENIRTDNLPQQTRPERQPRTNESSSLSANSDLRNVSNVSQSDFARNDNIKTRARNTTPISDPAARAGLPVQSQTQDLSSSHSPLNPSIPQPPLINDLIPARNRNRRQVNIIPNSTLIGFPSRRTQQSQFSRHQHPFTSRLLAFRQPTKTHNFQFDYPIENVLINENIPSSIAIKVNEAVEHDRFGNKHYNHHYVYEPTVQQLIVGNNQQIQRRLLGRSYHKGMRYIREIDNNNSYPQNQVNQTFGNLQLPIDSQYNFHSSSTPMYYFTAYALSNDPMRGY